MFEQFILYLKGYVRIHITGYSPERFINACRYRHIDIWDLKRVHGAYEMNLTIEGFRRLKEITRKTDTKVCIIRRSGLPFLLYKYQKRYILRCGLLICICLILLMTRFIWSIDIRGNLFYTDQTLIKFLAEKNIKSGMRKRTVDCTGIVHDLRKEYDRIIWVSAYVQGCRLIIQVKENEDGSADDTNQTADISFKEVNTGTDIIADHDCRITDIVTRAGVALVKKNMQVKKGEVLVSGQIPLYNDAKEVTAYTPCMSDADIVGEYSISYQDSIPDKKTLKKYYRSRYHFIQKKEYGIQLKNYCVSIGTVKNTYPVAVRKSDQKQFMLVGIIPLTVERTTVTPYREIQKNYSKKEVRRILTADFNDYCKEMEKKGVEIIQNDVKIYTGSKTYSAKGTLTIRSSIGKPSVSTPLLPDVTGEEETKNGD